MLGTYVTDNVNAGGSAIFIQAIVTHETTCRIVSLQSGESVLVVVNVHFEPNFLILRNVPERIRRIAFHWPRYPEG